MFLPCTIHGPKRLPQWLLLAVTICALCVTTGWAAAPDTLPDSLPDAPLIRRTLEVTWGEWFQSFGIKAFAVAYCMCLGGMLGSFLNVVIYRLPRGRSLVSPGSCCPKCGAKIALRDNIPVLGWIKLGGRCRNCRVWIPLRYPLVEAWVAGVWMLLGVLYLVYSGNHLPVRETLPHSAWLFWMRHWELPGLVVYHGVLLTILTAMALIKYDRQRLPRQLTWFLLLIGVMAPIVWPQLHPVPANVTAASSETAQVGALASMAESPSFWQLRWQGLFDTVMGATAGILLGIVLQLGNRRSHRDWSPGEGLIVSMVAVGAFLGWQAAVSVMLLAALLRLLWTMLVGRTGFGRSVPAVAFVVAAACAQVPGWKLFSHLPFWPQPTSNGMQMLLAAVAALLAGLLTRWLTPAETAADLELTAEPFYVANQPSATPRPSWADVLEPQRVRTLDV